MQDDFEGTENMRYDLWVEEALRGVIHKALQTTAKEGLHGDHHFYISFLTQAEGVDIPGRLRAQHPNDMTIVLQHQFEDLDIGENAFAVTLSFGGVKERLNVPYSAVISFADPSVNFALQLKMASLEGDEFEDEQFDAEHVDFFEAASRNEDDSNARGLDAEADEDEEPKTGEVITLDAFRKK